MEEEFRDIQGYEGLYQVSNLGRVKSLPRVVKCNSGYQLTKERILKVSKSKHNYLRVVLSNNKVTKTFCVHRLVAIAFIPNPNNYPIINHKDENCSNNCVENLEWCTTKYNLNYGTRSLRASKTNTNNPLRSIPIVAYKDGVEVMRFPSINEARRNGFRMLGVRKCCSGIWKQYKGLMWKYAI